LHNLGELPVDILKLDRSFLNPEKLYSNDSILWYLTRLAHSLKLTVVAEGLETFEQIQTVKIAGIPLVQGWYYSHDLPIEQLAKGFFSVTAPAAESRAR
jgi:sensor c-di-GMP phosphodiesterase-like protein